MYVYVYVYVYMYVYMYVYVHTRSLARSLARSQTPFIPLAETLNIPESLGCGLATAAGRHRVQG